jgi:hypothetical protein
MSNATYYRNEAARCRELAAHSPMADMANRWRALAADYDKLAGAIEQGGDLMAAQRVPMQRQPMQQQQAKTEPEDKT